VAAQIASVTVIKLSPFQPPKIFLQLVKVALDRDPPTPGLQFEQQPQWNQDDELKSQRISNHGRMGGSRIDVF